ncbi:MAG: radical SAM protein, partial [Bacteroidales bacterium]|nr:radical SAM protein [Bacteroidales bacterium]
MNPKVKDTLNIISKINVKRAGNVFKILFSYYFSRITGKTFHWGMPYSISFEPTTSCNLRCPECPSGLNQFTRPTGNLTFELFQNTTDQLSQYLFYMILYFQGEPFLNPDFFKIVKYAVKKKIYTATSTNAHFLNDENAKLTIESGLNRLIISLDGIDQETYSAYRIGGNYEKVIKGIKNIVKWKKQLKSATPYIIIQFLVFRLNEHQIDDIKKLGENLGVDEVRIKTAQFYDFKNGNPLIPTLNKYTRYKKQIDGTYSIKSKLPDYCYRMWSSCVITWDGLIVPCCFDKDAKYKLGDLKDNFFK